MHRNTILLISMLVIAGISTSPAVAAPTIKKLNPTTASNTQNNTSKQNLNRLSTSPRVSSVRSFGLSNPKTNTNNSINIAAKTDDNNNQMRLSALHNSVIKGLSTKLSTSPAQKQQQQQQSIIDTPTTLDLTQRVDDLETEISTKQENLESGDGINFDGKTISLNDEILTLPNKIDEINQEIDNLNQKISQIPGANVVDNFEPDFLLQ